MCPLVALNRTRTHRKLLSRRRQLATLTLAQQHQTIRPRLNAEAPAVREDTHTKARCQQAVAQEGTLTQALAQDPMELDPTTSVFNLIGF